MNLCHLEAALRAARRGRGFAQCGLDLADRRIEAALIAIAKESAR